MTDCAYSLVIGIDAYGGAIPRLTTAVNDATRLAELLRATHGRETILLTEPANGQPATPEAPVTRAIPGRMNSLNRLMARVHTRAVGVAPDSDGAFSDWTTVEVATTVVRPVAAIVV